MNFSFDDFCFCYLFLSSADKNSQRPPRKAYGRLSVDSDENCNRTTNTNSNTTNRQRYNNPFDELDNFDILDDSAKCSPNDNCGNANTQEHNDNDSDLELDSASSKSNCNERNDSTINRLQAMVISDDDDYGKWNFISFVSHIYTFTIIFMNRTRQTKMNEEKKYTNEHTRT